MLLLRLRPPMEWAEDERWVWEVWAEAMEEEALLPDRTERPIAFLFLALLIIDRAMEA